MTDTNADEQDVLQLTTPPPTQGTGLCLSGGGYRAMLFHLGALRRLNEAGRLQGLTRIASVSGGSIIAAQLGMVWRDLEFSGGSAGNFYELVEKPIFDLGSHTIDANAIVTGLLISGRISKRIQKSYDKHLFHGATLQDLPHNGQGPRFIILATNLTNGTLWRFSQPYMRDWRSEPVDTPTVPLAHAVAASSAFPPFLSPCTLCIPGRHPIQLTDGGVHDNLGLQPIVNRCETVLVSDGGGTFNESPTPKNDWVRGTLRILSTVDVQVRRLRRREINGLLASKQRKGAFWAINTDYSACGRSSPTLPAPIGLTTTLAMTKTRLARLDRTHARRLVNWGYAVCDAAIRTYVDPALACPDGFPYPSERLG
jgi:NTE family protein